MRVLQRKPVREEKKPQIPMWVPAWIKNDLGFEPGDESDWFLLEDDNGEKFGGLRRIAKKEKKEEEEEKKGEEKKEEKRDEEK